jgi:hypothetical protein
VTAPARRYAGRHLPLDCSIFGITVPIDSARLTQLYPTHAVYVQKMQQAADAAVAKRWLLPDDATDLMRGASTSSIPRPAPSSALVP